jgi:hypothetical protein
MRTMLARATGVVMAAAVVGCGGDDGPTPEQRVARAKWIQRVDGLCRKANAEIADRGYPVDLIDLDRLVVRGIEDVRGAIHAIARERIPEGAGPKPAGFVRELRELDEDLTSLSEASEDLDPHALVDAADDLSPRLESVERSAKAAGLRDCATHDERQFIPDAVRAPVFAEQVARLERRLLSRIQLIEFGQASSAGEFARAFSRYAALIDDAVEGIDKLDPPLWAQKQATAYQAALRDLQAVSRKFAARLAEDEDKPLGILDQGPYAEIQRDLGKASVAESRARRKMLRAVRAGPTSPPSAGSGEPEEPESTEVS